MWGCGGACGGVVVCRRGEVMVCIPAGVPVWVNTHHLCARQVEVWVRHRRRVAVAAGGVSPSSSILWGLASGVWCVPCGSVMSGLPKVRGKEEACLAAWWVKRRQSQSMVCRCLQESVEGGKQWRGTAMPLFTGAVSRGGAGSISYCLGGMVGRSRRRGRGARRRAEQDVRGMLSRPRR